MTAELAWNGFGAWEPGGYPAIARTDRVRRGEMNALGRYYVGGALTWQAHPLLSLVATTLVNLGDGSALMLPRGEWSLSDRVSLVFGGVFGVGAGLRGDGNPGSEYGAVPATVYGAVKIYF